MADNTEKLLKDIVRSLSSVEMAASSPDIDFTGIHERLDLIADRLGHLVDLNEHQTQALVDLREQLAPDEDESPPEDDGPPEIL